MVIELKVSLTIISRKGNIMVISMKSGGPNFSFEYSLRLK